jgi:hypothetical protein
MNKDVTSSMNWFIGVVEDREDPLQIGRLRVRIYHVHSPSKKDVPTSDLPWASVLVPVTSGALTGVGLAPVGVQVGTTVVGFFADGIERQVPVVLGCLPGLTDGQESKNDVSQQARGRNRLTKASVGPEPGDSYGAKYPFNRALVTSSGHTIEVDDTPGKERVHVFHKSGTYIEMRPDGTKVDKTNGQSFFISNGDGSIYVNGNLTLESTGSATIKSGGAMNISSGGSINMDAGGTFTVKASRITLDDGAQDTERY